MEISLPSETATEQFARQLAKALRPGDLLVLEGDLGAGKTFLVRALARAFGVPEEEPVTSPTFALVHEYALPEGGPDRLVHADLYRLGDPEELRELGLVEAIGSSAVVAVEWGERFADFLGPFTLLVRMRMVGDEARIATIEGEAKGVLAAIIDG
ncbi:MAG: tRNA (adenosine(37)-N6)-threonylcarbamoyltransferase complex ATPase subunit type 1 TsaE [Myxococcota bacterium]